MLKRLLVVVAFVALAGCAGLSSIKNPVTPERLAVAEAGYGAVLAVAVNYRRACIERKIPQSCRGVVNALRPYQAKAQAAIVSARQFVANNDSVNAITAVFAAEQAIGTFKTVSVKYGVQ